MIGFKYSSLWFWGRFWVTWGQTLLWDWLKQQEQKRSYHCCEDYFSCFRYVCIALKRVISLLSKKKKPLQVSLIPHWLLFIINLLPKWLMIDTWSWTRSFYFHLFWVCVQNSSLDGAFTPRLPESEPRSETTEQVTEGIVTVFDNQSLGCLRKHKASKVVRPLVHKIKELARSRDRNKLIVVPGTPALKMVLCLPAPLQYKVSYLHPNLSNKCQTNSIAYIDWLLVGTTLGFLVVLF